MRTDSTQSYTLQSSCSRFPSQSWGKLLAPHPCPAVDLVLRGGALRRPEAATIAAYFALFSVSLCLWSAQAFYARAFYAAGDTLRPMVASTVVTILSVPVYLALYHAYGGTGLVVASNIG